MKLLLSVVAPCFNEAQNLRGAGGAAEPDVSAQGASWARSSWSTTGAATTTGSRDRRAGPPAFRTSSRSITPSIAGSRPPGAPGCRRLAASTSASSMPTCNTCPEDVYRLLREIQLSNADLVQGYRSSVGRLKNSRYILSKGLNFILNVLFGMNMRDNKCGFVISRKEVLEDILAHRYRYRLLPDVHHGLRDRQGLHDPLDRDPVREPAARRVVPVRVPHARGAVVLRRPPEGLRRVPHRAQEGEHPGGLPGREPAAAARPRARLSGASSGWRRSSSACRCTSG